VGTLALAILHVTGGKIMPATFPRRSARIVAALGMRAGYVLQQ
jgi:hypothetical protein